VGLDDLDYLGVRVLAHRKLLLKGIADLKKHGVPTLQGLVAGAPSPTKAAAAQSSSSPLSSSSVGAEAKSAVSAVAPERVHWSRAPPLTGGGSNSSGGESAVPVNLADGRYDEAAAAREFQEAVAAWRNGGSSSNEVKGGVETSTSTATSHGAGGENNNSSSCTPSVAAYGSTSFALPGPETDAAHGSRDSGAAGQGADWWASADGKRNGENAQEFKGNSSSSSSLSGTSASLMAGEYDEAAAAREFQEAVAAWRNGGSSGGGGGGGEAKSSSSSSGSAGTGGAVARPSAAEVAEALAKQLDDHGAAAAAERAEARAAAEAQLKQQRQEVSIRAFASDNGTQRAM